MMTVDDRIIAVLVVLGLLAYAAQVPWLVLLRVRMGTTRHSPVAALLALLVDALIGLLVLMTLLFTMSAWATIRGAMQGDDDGTSLFGLLLVLVFVVKPLWIDARLWRWRWQQTRPGEGIADAASRAVQPTEWDGTERRGRQP